MKNGNGTCISRWSQCGVLFLLSFGYAHTPKIVMSRAQDYELSHWDNDSDSVVGERFFRFYRRKLLFSHSWFCISLLAYSIAERKEKEGLTVNLALAYRDNRDFALPAASA
jgi:hypothetical protein